MARYTLTEETDIPEDDPLRWRIVDTLGGRRSILLEESQADSIAWRLERQGPYRSEEEADEAADGQAALWGESP